MTCHCDGNNPNLGDSSRWEVKAEAIVKAVTLAVSQKCGQEVAMSLLPALSKAVVDTIGLGATEVIPFAHEAQEIVRAGRILGGLGYMGGASGNISMRLDDGTVLITPSGKRKGELRPEEMVRVDLAGNMLSKGPQKVSSEYMIHLQAYRSRSDINAVVHSHAPHATVFAAAHHPLDNTVLAEAWNMLGGPIPVVPFGAPSTPELAENLIPFLRNHNCFLLANHGAMTIASNLEMAVQMMETVEFLARIQILARSIGGENPLRGEEIRILREVEERKKARH